MGAAGLIAIIACPLFYAYSGMNGHDKIWRRLGVPIIWASAIFAHTGFHTLLLLGISRNGVDSIVSIPTLLLAIPSSFGALTIGYGIRDATDKGAVLGNFYLDLCKGNYWWANFCTRLTIYGLALLPMIWLR